jgi:hypothetical protein
VAVVGCCHQQKEVERYQSFVEDDEEVISLEGEGLVGYGKQLQSEGHVENGDDLEGVVVSEKDQDEGGEAPTEEREENPVGAYRVLQGETFEKGGNLKMEIRIEGIRGCSMDG